jgi:hypothetical protein
MKRITPEVGGKDVLFTIKCNRSVDENATLKRGVLGWAFSMQQRNQ